MDNEPTSLMREQLIRQGRAFFVVSLILLNLAAQYWGTNVPGGERHWWIPGVWSAVAVALIVLIIVRRHPKPRLPSILPGVTGVAIAIWGGYALSSRSLDYRYFIVLAAGFFFVAIAACVCIYSQCLANALKRTLGWLDNGTSLMLLVGLMTSLIKTFAEMADAHVTAWGTISLLLIGLLVAFLLTTDVLPHSVPPAVPRSSPRNPLFEEWRRERLIRKTLRRLSQQRVALILQPGNVWVVERAVSDKNEHVAAALRTCHLRGWVEILSNAVPHVDGAPGGHLPEEPLDSRVAPVYRLTEAGWNVIHRSHEWVLVTCAVAGTTLLATIIGIFIKT